MTTNSPPGKGLPPWRPRSTDESGLPDPRKFPTIDLETARRALGIGRTAAYRRAADGELAPGIPVIRVGRVFRVSTIVVRRALGIDPPAAEPAPRRYPYAPEVRRRASGDG